MTAPSPTATAESQAPALLTVIEHGTERGYRKCRPACEPCRAANRRAQAERRARRLAQPIPEAAHGRASTYTDRGCRCARCSEAALGAPKYKAPTRAEQEAASMAALGDGDTRTLRYEYPIYPEPAVEARLRRVVGAARYIYNQYVAHIDQYVAHIEAYKEAHGRYPTSSAGLSAQLITLPRANPETAWLSEVPHTVLSYALRHGETALSNHLSSLAGTRKRSVRRGAHL